DSRAVDARLASEGERFTHAGQRAADRDLVANLADLPGARIADVDDPFRIPHAGENRLDALECRRLAADHDRQRGIDRADLAAAPAAATSSMGPRLRL